MSRLKLIDARRMEKRFKRIMGYQQLWMLEAKLRDLAEDATVDTKSQVA